jgi:hypothetical protein
MPKCSDAKKRQNVHCGGNRTTFRMPVSIGSRVMNRRWFSREKPTYPANTIAKTNWYMLMARVTRFTLSVSSISS